MVVGNLRENEKVSEHCACRAFVRMERLTILKSYLFDRDGIVNTLPFHTFPYYYTYFLMLSIRI